MRVYLWFIGNLQQIWAKIHWFYVLLTVLIFKGILMKSKPPSSHFTRRLWIVIQMSSTFTWLTLKWKMVSILKSQKRMNAHQSNSSWCKLKTWSIFHTKGLLRLVRLKSFRLAFIFLMLKSPTNMYSLLTAKKKVKQCYFLNSSFVVLPLFIKYLFCH